MTCHCNEVFGDDLNRLEIWRGLDLTCSMFPRLLTRTRVTLFYPRNAATEEVGQRNAQTCSVEHNLRPENSVQSSTFLLVVIFRSTDFPLVLLFHNIRTHFSTVTATLALSFRRLLRSFQMRLFVSG